MYQCVYFTIGNCGYGGDVHDYIAGGGGDDNYDDDSFLFFFPVSAFPSLSSPLTPHHHSPCTSSSLSP